MIIKTTKTTSGRVLTGLASILLILIGFSTVGWGQANVPVSRTIWNSTPTGWTDAAGGSYLSSFACSGNNSSKFDTSGDKYIVNFSGVADKLSFVVKSNSATTSSLLVEESSDGVTYSTVVSLSGTANLPTTCTTKGPYTLLSTSKFVKWTFTKGSSNATMDDVSITAQPCTAPASPTTPAFTKLCGSTEFAAIPNTGTESTFWQTTVSGISELDPANVIKTVSSTTTLYLRTKSSTGCWSNAVTVTPSVFLNPIITIQPSNQSAIENQSATFSVTATNASGYQWQISTDNGVSWTDISGETNSSTSLSNVTLAMDGFIYRALVKATIPCTDITSSTATLNVLTGPCLDEANFTSTPSGWTSNSVSYSSNEANFTANTGEFTTLLLTNPTLLTFDLRRSSNSTAKSLAIEVSTTNQGGPFTTIFTYDHSNTTSSNTTNCTVDLSAFAPSTSIYIRFRKASSTTSPWYLRNVKVFCTPPVTCTPTGTITSFIPTSGPAATLVTITGTGFTGATEVKFGGVDATTFTIINSTTIIAKVPTGIGANSIISVSDMSSCETVSPGSFTLSGTVGSCSSFPNYTDLFISEIYDSQGLNVWNIELYNPTSNSILLTGNYQIKRAGDITDPSNYSRTIDLIGSVPPNSVFTISAGDSPQECNGVSFNFTEDGAGINDNDIIALFKNTVLVDVSHAPNEKGYSLLRNIDAGVTAPSVNYISGDWTVNLNEVCTNMGIFNFPTTSIVITAQPADVTGCSLTMSVTSPTPSVTYQWKFNNPETMTGWQDVNSTNIPLATISGETTSNLSITGDVAGISDFQFYCEVSLTGCSVASNAAQFKMGNRPIYRSVVSSNGNWSTVANWEMSTDYTNYVAACSYPRSINSSEVIIQTGTRIVLDLSLDIDKITIQNTGTLEMSPSSKLTIYDSTAGADLIVNGTLYDRNSALYGMDLFNAATWILGGNGTFIKSNNSANSLFRDQYEGGMNTIPATANWIYRRNGDGIPIVGTLNFFYPNLYFENTTATPFAWENIVNTSFQGNAGFATVKGNFNIGTTGTNTCTVSNINTNAQPMLIYGNLTIAAGSSLLNNASSGITFGTGFELKGNLLVDGTLHILGGSLERVMRFTGTTNQTVSGTGIIDLYKMTVNKASGDILLSRDLQAQNELLMTKGNILTNTNILELGLSITQKGILSHTNGFVVGKMRRWFNGTNSGDISGLYPMGFNDSGLKNRNAKIEFNVAPAAGGHLTVEYIGVTMGLDGIPIPAANTGGFGYDVTTTEDKGYWKIDNEAGKLIGANYTIACTGEGYNTITSLLQLTLLKRIGVGNWFCPGAHLAVTGTIAKPTVSRSGVSNWSNFGFGGSVLNPLPVTLTAFSVSCGQGNSEMDIRWTTASEQNASHFVVEKSYDMTNWTFVSKVQAAGNSNHEINYNSKDSNRSNGVLYYRLNQVDYNGEAEIYLPISVSCVNGNNAMNVYPNPSKEDFTLEISWSESATQAQIQVIDLTGKIINEMNVNLNNGTTQVEFSQTDLQIGTYLIRLNTEKMEGLKPVRLVITR